MAAWRACAAQVLVLELFPFGRRQMRFELLPLLEAAVGQRPRPLIVCSVRDILGGQRGSQRQAEGLAVFERYFDRVMVHGDPEVVPFGRSFDPSRRSNANSPTQAMSWMNYRRPAPPDATKSSSRPAAAQWARSFCAARFTRAA